MAENEDSTVSEEPEAAPETQPEASPEPEPTPAPGVVDEGFVIVHGRGGRKRVPMSEYRAMKEAEKNA